MADPEPAEKQVFGALDRLRRGLAEAMLTQNDPNAFAVEADGRGTSVPPRLRPRSVSTISPGGHRACPRSAPRSQREHGGRESRGMRGLGVRCGEGGSGRARIKASV